MQGEQAFVVHLDDGGMPLRQGPLIMPCEGSCHWMVQTSELVDLSTAQLWLAEGGRGEGESKFRRLPSLRATLDGSWCATAGRLPVGNHEFVFIVQRFSDGSAIDEDPQGTWSDGPWHGREPSTPRSLAQLPGSPGWLVGPRQHIAVLPRGPNDQELAGLSMQTVLTRCVGPCADWPSRLGATLASGCNMVHLSPVQQLGASGSAYSIKDQLAPGASLSPEPEPVPHGDTTVCGRVQVAGPDTARAAGGSSAGAEGAGAWSGLRAALEELRSAGAGAACDLVPNHTADDSDWLLAAPDAAFTPANSPWLSAAYSLDTSIMNFSAQLCSGSAQCPAAAILREVVGSADCVRKMYEGEAGPLVNCEATVDACADAMEAFVKEDARVWEYYVMDVDAAVASAVDGLALVPAAQEAEYWQRASAAGSDAAALMASAVQDDTLKGELLPADSTGQPMPSAGAACSSLTTEYDAPSWHSLASIKADLVQSCADALLALEGGLENPTAGGLRFPVKVRSGVLAAAVNWLACSIGEPPLRQKRWAGMVTAAAGDTKQGVEDAARPPLPPLLPLVSAKQAGAAGGGELPSDLVLLLRRVLEAVNLRLYERYDADFAAAMKSTRSTMKHRWLSEFDGAGRVSLATPLVNSYFVRWDREPWEGQFSMDPAKYAAVFACNGFVWGGDPKVPFIFPDQVARSIAAAEAAAAHDHSPPLPHLGPDGEESAGPQVSQSDSGNCGEHAGSSLPWGFRHPVLSASCPFVRREVVIWGDCVKLRYGDGKDLSTPLWQRMLQYACETAASFDGVRLDNCHGTPLHVSATLVRAMRRVRPNLLVFAELFTDSWEVDAEFVSVLGISALVRDTPSSDSSTGLAALVGGNGVAGSSLAWGTLASLRTAARDVPTALPSILYDCTHDNELPAQRHSVQQTLPIAAAVSFSSGPIGSTRGVDELLPKQLNVVTERRLYAEDSDWGMLRARRVLSRFHSAMARWGLRECFAEVLEESGIVKVQRTSASSGICVTLLAHAFPSGVGRGSKTTVVDGDAARVVVLGRITAAHCGDGAAQRIAPVEHEVDWHQVAGLEECLGAGSAEEAVAAVEGAAPLPGAEWGVAFSSHEASKAVATLDTSKFACGSIAVLVSFVPRLSSLTPPIKVWSPTEAVQATGDGLLEGVSMDGLRHLLFLCEAEERDATGGEHGVYVVPGHGALAWAGLAGIEPLLRDMLREDGTWHAIAHHARHGLWYVEYAKTRASRCDELDSVCAWLEEVSAAAAVPTFRRPAFLAATVLHLYHEALRRVWRLMGAAPVLEELEGRGQDFDEWRTVHAAALSAALPLPAALQLCLTCPMLLGETPSAPLLRQKRLHIDGAWSRGGGSLAAGLPHFSTGYMRCWGRDTFIALRGLLLATGQRQAALQHIAAFASEVEHGLVPNLHNAGERPRFNARDAVWWWAQAVVDTVALSQGDASADQAEVLGLTVRRRGSEAVCTVADVLVEVLQAAWEGRAFVEEGAGPAIDEHMQEEGFHVSFGVPRSGVYAQAGLVPGGNPRNCGTWMDKMGSTPGLNAGVPATPRHGAPIELTALQASVLKFAVEQGLEVPGVPVQEWLQRLSARAGDAYWIPTPVPESPTGMQGASQEDMQHHVRSVLVSQWSRGGLRDTVASGPAFDGPQLPDAHWEGEFAEYQQRCNQLLALAVAPWLFDSSEGADKPRLSSALALCERQLLGCGSMGVRTLSPADAAFRGAYDNSAVGDKSTAAGWNYHQGPEWLWPFGYYWRARLHLKRLRGGSGGAEALHQLWARLAPHVRHLARQASHGGLPELMNQGNTHCHDGCPVQAWSSATVLDALLDTAGAARA